jgi:hypothetical protein
MKIIISLLSIVLLVNFSALSQKQTARKVDERRSTSYEDIDMCVQNIRDTELSGNPKLKLYIINYGTFKLVKDREKQLRGASRLLQLKTDQVELSTPIQNPFLLTEFWIVPEKAENPSPTKYAERFDKIGVATDNKVKLRIQQFQERMEKTPNSIAYFINYGSQKQKAIRVKQINKSIDFQMQDGFRMIIVDGGYSKTVKTELWISNTIENNN